MSRWYRAYEGTVTDAKIGEAALVAGCSRSVAIAAWHCILESCAAAQKGGEYDTTPRRVAVILCEPLPAISALFDAFAELGMLGNGGVMAWKETQSGRLGQSEWREIIAVVFHRDNYSCRYCGSRGGRLECDHIIPLSRGGSNDLENLAAACRPCNRTKLNRTPEEMGWTLS